MLINVPLLHCSMPCIVLRRSCQPPGTPWRQQPSYQQPLPRAPPSTERMAGRAAGTVGLAQNMFRGGDSNGSSNGNDSSDAQQQQHMGSGGRSRKRSLNPDMAAASQGSQGSEQPAKFARGSSSQLPDIAEEDDH
jgi:hypothetical protein